MNRTEEYRERNRRIDAIVVRVLIVIALSADIAGPTRASDAKLAGLDLGLKFSAVPALFAEQTGGKDTAQGASKQTTFGGGYSSLSPQQQSLVDDWFQRFSSIVKKPVDPAEGYEKIPLSAKTTFDAVTHALMKTELTDESGKKLAGSALDLVGKLDTVAGQILGAGGDQQFRIFVQMKPDAVSLLNQSREFKHASDNTSYHKGYPICYRGKSGTPSIQISLTRDAERADIDVDYRSSGWTGLVNGHLTAANSDVRAGDNLAKHNNQWSGLQNWWRNLLGLPLLENTNVEGQVIAQEPGRKDAKPADAIFDFLNSWLVEQKPNESMAYFANEAYACMDAETEKKSDRGMSKFLVLQNMQSANARIGRISSLREASTGFALTSTRVKPIKQAHSSEFVLYDVREDLAEEFKCGNQKESADSVKEMKSRDFGKYVGAVFRISAKGEQGRNIATLWQRNHGYWKMVSYDVDPELERNAVPDAGAPPAKVAPLAVVDGDKDMIKAASDFLKLWLVKKDVDSALQYLTPECLDCARLYRSDDSSPSSTAGESLKEAMTRIATAIGPVNRLDDAIVAAQPNHPDMKLVKHRDDKAFVIASIPEYMGEAAKCDRRDVDGDPIFSPAPATGYGKYYASGFSVNEGKSSPAALWIVWTKVNGSWKALAYVLLDR